MVYRRPASLLQITSGVKGPAEWSGGQSLQIGGWTALGVSEEGSLRARMAQSVSSLDELGESGLSSTAPVRSIQAIDVTLPAPCVFAAN